MKSLNDLIDEAYKLFSPYKMTGELAICDCGYCFPKEEIQTVLKTDIHNLPRYTLYQYLDSTECRKDSMLTEQIRYLLPRILELMVLGEYLRHSNEILLDKLYCDHSSWKSKEVEFLQEFATEYLLIQIDKQDFYDNVFDITLMFHNAKLDHTDSLLSIIFNSLERPKVLRDIVYEIYFGGYGNAFADESFIKKINSWLTSAKVVDKLTQAILQAIDNEKLNSTDCYRYEQVFDIIHSH